MTRDVQLEAALILILMKARKIAETEYSDTVTFSSPYGDVTAKLAFPLDAYWYEENNGKG